MSITEKLLQKITSKDQLIEAVGEREYRNATMQVAQMAGLDNIQSVAWWAVRERLRVSYAVYDTTEALDKVNGWARTIYAHISTDDRNLVAYTPDRASGEADRQVRTTIGRLISKYMPFVTDSYIQALETEHRAEVSNEVEFITGPQIAETYLRGMGGVGACMSGKSSFKIQPTLAYDAEHIALAVVRNARGEIAHRTMVYMNGDDKRMMRTYPAANAGRDSLIAKRLKSQGFKFGGWVGVRFRPVNAHTGETYTEEELIEKARTKSAVALAMPYLDGNGSMSSGAHCTVAVLDGKLVGVSPHTTAALTYAYNKNGASYTHCSQPSSGGVLTVVPVNSEDFLYTDAVSGETFSALLYKAVDVATPVYSKAGEFLNLAVGRIKIDTDKEEIDHFISNGYVQINTFNEHGKRMSVWAPNNVPTFYAGHYSGMYGAWADTEANRKATGFVRLDPEFYPEDRGWYESRYRTLSTAACQITDDAGQFIDRWIKYTDAVRVVTEGPKLLIKHKATLTKKYVKLHQSSKTDHPAYVAPGVKYQVTTSGRKVHPRIHDISYTWDGKWEFDRKIESHINVGGTAFGYRKGEYSKAVESFAVRSKVNELCEAEFQFHNSDLVWAFIRMLENRNHYAVVITPELAPAMYAAFGTATVRSYRIADTYRACVDRNIPAMTFLKENMTLMRKCCNSYEKLFINWFEAKIAEVEALDYSVVEEARHSAVQLLEIVPAEEETKTGEAIA